MQSRRFNDVRHSDRSSVLNIGILVCPDFQALDLAVTTVFEQANLLADQPVYEVGLFSENGGEVRCSPGFTLFTRRLDNPSFDTLIVLGSSDCRLPGPGVIEYLRRSPHLCRRVASLWTGVFTLAEARLLDERRATTHWAYARSLGARYPRVSLEHDRIFVNDGQLWTSAGLSTGIDMALTMVEKDRGAEAAQAIARNLVLYHRRGGGQSQFSALLHMGPRSDRVQAAISFAKENIKAQLSVAALAAVARLSPRQFTRVLREETGLSPAKAVERLRVEAARLMLETSQHSLEIIARETGFGDRDRMRLSFLRAFGQPPQAILRNLRNGTADPA
jgi:transcriptional regulator GlxA family with amidase domain